MIAWTIYATVAGAIVAAICPAALFRPLDRALDCVVRIRARSSRIFFPDLDPAHLTTIVSVPWVPALGIDYHLAFDGISLTLVLVTGIVRGQHGAVLVGCR